MPQFAQDLSSALGKFFSSGWNIYDTPEFQKQAAAAKESREQQDSSIKQSDRNPLTGKTAADRQAVRDRQAELSDRRKLEDEYERQKEFYEIRTDMPRRSDASGNVISYKDPITGAWTSADQYAGGSPWGSQDPFFNLPVYSDPEAYGLGPRPNSETKTTEKSSAPEAAPLAPESYKQPTYVPVREYIDLGNGDWTLGNPIEEPYGSFSQDDLLKMYPDFEEKYIFGDGNLEDLAYELAGQGSGYQYLVDQSIEDPEKAFEDLFAKAAMAYPDYSEEEILGLLDAQAAAYTMQDLIRMLGSYYNPDDPNSTRWARATAAQQRYDAQHPQSTRSE